MGRMAGQKTIAFIGSRDLNLIPPEGLSMYKQAAQEAANRNYIVSTGAAPGADQLAAEIALRNGGRVNLEIPWPSYEQDWISSLSRRYGDNPITVRTLNPYKDSSAMESVSIHPNAQNLRQGAYKLMARNYNILFPESNRASSVLAIPRPPLQGGTKHGIDLAENFQIPSFNLSTSEGRSAFEPYLSRSPS